MHMWDSPVAPCPTLLTTTIYSTGEPDGPPCKVGVAVTDIATGLYAHGAIMAALLSRQQTGQGVWIDCNLFESQVRRQSPDSHIRERALNTLTASRPCEYRFKLPHCRPGRVAARHLASVYRSVPSLPVQGRFHHDWGRKRQTGPPVRATRRGLLTRVSSMTVQVVRRNDIGAC